jgi:hypothetical protein
MFRDRSTKTNILWEELQSMPLNNPIQNQSLACLKNINDMQKSLAKQSPSACPNLWYGTTQSNCYPEHLPPFQEGSFCSHKKNMKRQGRSLRNISNEEQSECPNPCIVPTSFMSERRTRNCDLSKTTDPPINGQR